MYAELPNFPKKTKLGTNTQQVRIDNVSPDGNIISGIIDFTTPITACYYVYNKTTQECKYVDNALGEVPDETFVDESTMSNNGKYLTGIVQVAGVHISQVIFTILATTLAYYIMQKAKSKTATEVLFQTQVLCLDVVLLLIQSVMHMYV